MLIPVGAPIGAPIGVISHRSTHRSTHRDQFIPYIIKLSVPDNNIVGNPDLIIRTLVVYYDRFKLVFPVIVKDVIQLLIGTILWAFNYIKNKFKSFITHRELIWAKRRALSDRILKKRMRELDLEEKRNERSYDNK